MFLDSNRLKCEQEQLLEQKCSIVTKIMDIFPSPSLTDEVTIQIEKLKEDFSSLTKTSTQIHNLSSKDIYPKHSGGDFPGQGWDQPGHVTKILRWGFSRFGLASEEFSW